MKKALSVILSVLMIFSVFGMFAAAEGDLVTIKFVVETDGDDIVIRELQAAPGVNFVDRIVDGGDIAIGIPVKESTETTKYTFQHWVNTTTGEITHTGNVPAVSQKEYDEGVREIVYLAVFAEEEIKENQTFWAFIQSIFERINKIFEYFERVFEGIF